MNYINLLLAWPYWVVFFTPVLFAIIDRHVSAVQRDYMLVLYTLVLVVFVGLRDGIGTDWPNYMAFIRLANDVPLSVGLGISDPGYALLNWVGANFLGGIYLPNFICAVLAVVPLVIFARRQAFPWISLFVVFPWLVVVAQMGFTRQGAAIGMIIMLIMALENGHFRRALIYLAAATLLHRTAVAFTALIFLVTLLSKGNQRVLKSVISLAWGGVIAGVVFGLDIVGKTNQYLVEPLQDTLINNPEAFGSSLQDAGQISDGSEALGGSAFQSSGAILRTGIGFVAAAIYAIFFATSLGRREPKPRNLIWILMCLAQVLLFPLAFVASTLADRLAFYLIPLQVHVAGMVNALVPIRARPLLSFTVFAIYAFMFVVWLIRSDYASDWLPYNNILTHIW